MGPGDPPEATIIRRPLHWGIVVVVTDDWAGDLPELEPDAPVSASERALVVGVRHAQDSDESDGEHLKLAETEVKVRLLHGPTTESDSRRELFRGPITVPSGAVSVGDADGWTTAPAHAGDNIAVVSVDAHVPTDDSGPDAVRVDFLPDPRAES